MPLRVALFVEGSFAPLGRRRQLLHSIWNDRIASALGLSPFDPIVPISKTHLIAMDPQAPAISGAGEALDELFTRTHRMTRFQAAVVAWDLHPKWNPEAAYCRWNETVDLYRLLAQSNALDAPWKHFAHERFDDLRNRPEPSSRAVPAHVTDGSIIAVCMEPMFEAILAQDERCVRRALGITGRHLDRWPNRGWGDPAERQPDSRVLAPAIRATRLARPRPRVASRIIGDFVTHKDDWNDHLLRSALADPECRGIVLGHPALRRLREVMA